MEHVLSHSHHPQEASYPSANLRVANPSLSSPDLNLENRDVKRKKLTQNQPARHEKSIIHDEKRRERFRPPGYTSAAPWLRKDGELWPPASRTQAAMPTSQTEPSISNLPNPHAFSLARSREDDTSVDTPGTPPLGDGPGVRLAVIRPLQIANRRSSAPPSVGEYRDVGYGEPQQAVGSRYVARRRTSDVSTFALLEPPRHPRDAKAESSASPLAHSLDNNEEMGQTHSHPSSVSAQSNDSVALRPKPSLHQQRPLPEVAISASSLILGGEDIYQDTRVASPPVSLAPPNPPAPMPFAQIHSGRRMRAAHPACRRPTLHLGVQGLSFIEEDRESTFRPIGNENISQNHSAEYSQNRFGVTEMARRNATSSEYAPQLHGQNYMPNEQHQSRRIITSQPQPHPHPHPTMAVEKAVGNRNAKGMPYAADGTRDWSTDLCLFCDHNLGTCCKALWCPCIVYGRNKARIEHLYAEHNVHPTRGGTCSDDCVIHACLTTFCLFGWAIQIPNRASVRRRYNIEGDWLGDCAAALFCSSCELSQESREIELEERSLGDQS